MNHQRLTHAACLLAAAVLNAAQRVCMPLLPGTPLTAARLVGEGVFLLVALGIGVGISACSLAQDGRVFQRLYLHCAGASLLCKGAGLLLWQQLGSQWVIVLYLSEAAITLWCSWCLCRSGNEQQSMTGARAKSACNNHPRSGTLSRKPMRLFVLLLTLLACGWVQVFVCSRCQPFMPGSSSHRYALQHLSLPIVAGEWLVCLACCWLMLPGLPETWQTRPNAAMVLLLLAGCLPVLGLVDGLLKPDGFLKGLSQTSAITSQSLDGAVLQPWHSELSRWAVQRRRGDAKEDRECLRLLTLRDQQGRTAARALLTDLLTEETLQLEGQTVELLHPYGLLLPEGDTLRMIRLDDLPAQQEHPLLTAFCHHRLTDFRLLPAVGSYLLRHQPEAVQLLLERYVTAAFTPEELAAMGDIDPEWISRTARRLLAP